MSCQAREVRCHGLVRGATHFSRTRSGVSSRESCQGSLEIFAGFAKHAQVTKLVRHQTSDSGDKQISFKEYIDRMKGGGK